MIVHRTAADLIKWTEKASVFGSAMAPFKLVFRTDAGGEYTVLYAGSEIYIAVSLTLKNDGLFPDYL